MGGPAIGRLIAWLAVVLAASYLVFVGGGWLGIYTSALRVITVLAAAVVLGGWAIVAARRPEWVLAIHGGAGSMVAAENLPQYRAGLEEAV